MSRTPIAKTSVWYQALSGDKPKDKASWVLAELNDGTRIWGYVHYFTLDDTGNDRDISFTGPGLTIQPPNRDRQTETYYKYFVVRAAHIKVLKVAHEKKKAFIAGSHHSPPPRDIGIQPAMRAREDLRFTAA